MTSRGRVAAVAAGAMILSLFGTLPAQAATTTQLATADTMARGDQPSSEFGNNTTMRVDEAAPKISYVQFPAAPAGTVTDAKLKVHGTGNTAADFKVYAIADNWTEAALNYSNRPALGAQVGAGRFVASGTTTVDVDAGVTGGQVTSLAIVRTVAAPDTILSTRETANDPQLVVTTGDVTPPPTNQAPTVNAGPDQAITLPDNNAALDGTVSDDGLPAGSSVSSTWTGPAGVTFANAAAVDTVATFPSAGTYTLTLSATDGALTTTNDVVVTVNPEPTPANDPPTVNAGPDQTITLPDDTAALDATVNDPDSAETVLWTGPAGVTFADATAVDTTATFPAAGTFDLRLTANDGVNPAVSDVVRVVVNPAVTPPPAGDTIRSIALSRTTLMSLPTSGAQWDRLVTMANGTYSYSTTENNPEASGNIVSGALVCQRANVTAICNRVNAALDTFQGQAPGTWSHAGFNREAVGIVQAGDIMGRNTTAWRNALTSHIRGAHDSGGGSTLQTVLQEGALKLSNNHGRAAFQTYAAIVAALNLTAEANDLCASAKAWQGGTHTENGGWTFSNGSGARVMEAENEAAAQTWYASKMAGINPGDPAASIRNAAVPGDVHRDNGSYPNPGAKGIEQYIFGALFRQAAGDISLAGMGCNLFTYADDSLTRARLWVDRYGVDPDNFHAHGDNLMEYLDGVNYSAAGGSTTAVGESVTVAASWIGPGSGNTWLR